MQSQFKVGMTGFLCILLYSISRFFLSSIEVMREDTLYLCNYLQLKA